MIKELGTYLWKNRLWWLIPPVIVFLVFGVLIAVSALSPVSPFIYVLF
jgi:hypothetical protein